MGRRAKPRKGKPDRKSTKNVGSQVRDLEKRLAEALQREAAAAKREAEALEQQAATSKILELISSSPTDLQRVLDAMAESAARLCGAYDAVILRLDGDVLRVVAHHGPIPGGRGLSVPVVRGTVGGRTVLDRTTVHVADLHAEAAEFPEGSTAARERGHRTILSVPLLREGAAIGAIHLRRTEVQPFADKEIELLKTFADQAVIAIENVRLFTELQRSNHGLKAALDQQTATADILGVISRSQTDLQPVFDAILTSAVHLLRAHSGFLNRIVGTQIELVALKSPNEASEAAIRALFPQSLQSEGVTAQAIRDRAPLNIVDFEVDSRVSERARVTARLHGYRSWVVVPILLRADPVGAILIARRESGGFTDDEIALLQTFADQAVIAIENVRLFNETKEALEQQTATAEILRVISQSPTDIQPVLDAVTANAAAVCGATDALIMRVEGQALRRVAHFGPIPLVLPALRPLTQGSVAGHAILECRTIHVHDILAADAARDYPETMPAGAGPIWRTMLAVPLAREGVAIGAILIRRTEIRPFTAKEIQLLETFADQAVIAIENVRLFKELQASNHELTTALEQQTVTSEILRVISSSPTDVQPVFDMIVRSAVRLCGGMVAGVSVVRDGMLYHPANYGGSPEALAEIRGTYPRPLDMRSSGGVTVLTRSVYEAPDAEDPSVLESVREAGRILGVRSFISVPMLREGEAIGAIAVTRREPGRFSEGEVALLQTFADQAVIAIENVRLFTELEGRNRDLTATSEILRVISSSPTDVRPVFDTIIRSAVGLCEGLYGTAVRFDGERMHLAAGYNHTPEVRQALEEAFPMRPDRRMMAGRAILARTVVQVEDALDDPEYAQDVARAGGFRSMLAVPMMREGNPIGAIVVNRGQPGSFSVSQIDLLKTFADQAVIAIENVRLFTELQTSNRDLTKALDTQTATSDILRVISGSRTDVQPVFDAIVQSAVRLLGADTGMLGRLAGDQVELDAMTSIDPVSDAVQRALFPVPLGRGVPLLTSAIRDRTPINITDIQSDPRIPEAVRDSARALGSRSRVMIPLLRHGEAIGVIVVARREAGGFTGDEIALLQTFADQAVIAIENARLLNELQARTDELTRSVGELRALGAVGQALSSTLDVDVVLNTIVTRANDLIGADGCTIFEYEEGTEEFHLRATRNLEPRLIEVARGTPLRKGDQGILGKLPTARQAVQVPDITAGSYSSPISDALIEAGYRAVVAVPLIREDHLIGALTMNRKTPGEFPPETIELLQTFATQSALAIQNARLFREIEQKSRELEAASRHKSEFLANMSHELRTPLNAIIGFSEVLSERMFGELNEKQDEYLKDIYTSGQHLLSLINDILDLSKVEAGRMELEATDFDLPGAIDNALTLVRERATRRGITLGRTIDGRVGVLRGDERKVKQVLLNLLSNALKFTPEGGRIDVSAHLQDGAAAIAVTDTGVGIAPGDQGLIFEEFRQVGTADKKVEGTGLGLALSRKFIELHGGRIWVESELGKGSTFTFTLPLRRESG